MHAAADDDDLPAQVCCAATLLMLLRPAIQRSWCRVRQTRLASNSFRSMRVEAKKGSNASKAVAKTNLPTKICVVCQRPFTW